MNNQTFVPKHLISFALITIISLFFICAKQFSNQKISSITFISGIITDQDFGVPIKNAQISVDQITETFTSDKNGKFEIQLNSGGTYKISFESKGYETITKEITIQLNEQKKLNIELVAMLLPPPAPVEVVEDAELKMEPGKSYLYKNYSRSEVVVSSGYAPSSEIYMDDLGYNTEEYDAIFENGFKKVIGNPLSTFSIDVDNASYSNIRRFITASQTPPKDAVRIEEMINYFDYEYEQPKNDIPFATFTEISDCPWNEKSKLIMIGLQGKDIEYEKTDPSNLVFLLDVSGSMDSPNKLPLVKNSLYKLIDQLGEKDKIAIAVYAGAAGLVLPSTPASDKEKIKNALNMLSAGGSTAGGAGLQLAYDKFFKMISE